MHPELESLLGHHAESHTAGSIPAEFAAQCIRGKGGDETALEGVARLPLPPLDDE